MCAHHQIPGKNAAQLLVEARRPSVELWLFVMCKFRFYRAVDRRRLPQYNSISACKRAAHVIEWSFIPREWTKSFLCRYDRHFPPKVEL